MTAPVRSRLAVGLGVLLLGVLSPAAAAASPDAPSSSVEPTPSTGAGDPSASPAPRPSTSRSYAPDPSGFALMVSPARLVLSPQDLGRTQQITVINRSSTPLPVRVQKRNFSTKPDGSLAYAQDAPWAAADWLRLSPNSFEIPPGAEQLVQVTTEVPAQPDAGDHQVALIFLVPSVEAEGNVRINRGVGVPAYVRATGDADDSVELGDLRAPAFTDGGPVTVRATLRSTGTVHRDFRGPGALSAVGSGPDARFADFTVARGGTREVSTTWDPPIACVCHLQVSVTNPGGDVQTRAVRVIVFPWPAALAVLGAVLLLLLVLRTTRRVFRAKVAQAAAELRGEAADRDDPPAT